MMITRCHACLGNKGSGEREQQEGTQSCAQPPAPPERIPFSTWMNTRKREMGCLCGIVRLMALGFMKMWTRNYFLIRNVLTKCPKEGLCLGEVARCFGCGFCSSAMLRQGNSSWGLHMVGECVSLCGNPHPLPPSAYSALSVGWGKPGSEEGTRFRHRRGSALGQVSAELVRCAGLSRTLWSHQLSPRLTTGGESRQGCLLRSSVLCVTRAQRMEGTACHVPKGQFPPAPARVLSPHQVPRVKGVVAWHLNLGQADGSPPASLGTRRKTHLGMPAWASLPPLVCPQWGEEAEASPIPVY